MTTEVSLAPLFRRLENRFDAVAARRGLELRLVPSGARVRSDMALLAQILDHVVSNAVTYTVSGRILVGCRRRGDRLSLEVWDTGPGLPAAHRRGFMHPRGPAADALAVDGDGFGLAVVDRLARLLDHPLTVDVVPGRGTRFSLSLPLAQPPGAASGGGGGGQRRPLMVVIDDEEAVLEGMRLLLETWQYEVVAASSGEDAVALLLRRGDDRPDGIIADYRLREGRTGAEAVRQLRALYRSLIPSIIITGEGTFGRLAEAEGQRLTILQKPVAAPRLQSILSATLKGKR